jgi:apolipoprotein D and lipocalin family protein
MINVLFQSIASRLMAVLRRLMIPAFVMLSIALGGCISAPENPNPKASTPIATIPLDLPRYMGKWYIVANIPYFGERGFVGTHSVWELREDGRIDDHFYAYKKSFDAPLTHYQFLNSVVPGSEGGEWKVRLFWPIHVRQLTLYVDPDYQYTLVAYPGKKLGWIFAREPRISDEVYQSLLQRFDEMGYDISRFRRVPQFPEQIGQPGFTELE